MWCWLRARHYSQTGDGAPSGVCFQGIIAGVMHPDLKVVIDSVGNLYGTVIFWANLRSGKCNANPPGAVQAYYDFRLFKIDHFSFGIE